MPQVKYNGKDLQLKPDQTLLECLEENGFSVPNSCRNGICQSCLMHCVTPNKLEQTSTGLRKSHVHDDLIMACVCKPEESIEVADLGTKLTRPKIRATVVEQNMLNHNVLRLRLKPETDFEFTAGQFLQLNRLDDNLARCYSIASVPSDEHIELHIRLFQNGAMSGPMICAELIGTEFDLSLAQGSCVYSNRLTGKPLLLVGNGTGLAPLFGIIRNALSNKHEASIRLVLGARKAEDLYYLDELKQLASEHANFSFEVAPHQPENRQALFDHVKLNYSKLDKHACFLCGSPSLVKLLKKHAFLAGASMAEIFCDSFETAAKADHAIATNA